MVQSVNILATLVQIGFWLTVATVAILTYRRASKSLLQPVKTEVFKLQVNRLQEMLEEFPWRNSVDAWDKSGLEECLVKNAFKMLQRYASSRFKIEIVEEQKACRDAVGVMLSQEWAEKNLVVITPENSSDGGPDPEQYQDWSAYEHGDIDYFKKFDQVAVALQSFSADPLIPVSIAKKVEAVLEAHSKGLSNIGETLSEVSKRLPDVYPTLDDIRAADLVWVSNEVEGTHLLFEELEVLRQEVRSYLGTDRLLEF